MKRFTRYRRIKIRKRKRKQRKQKGGFLDFGYLAKSLAQKGHLQLNGYIKL